MTQGAEATGARRSNQIAGYHDGEVSSGGTRTTRGHSSHAQRTPGHANVMRPADDFGSRAAAPTTRGASPAATSATNTPTSAASATQRQAALANVIEQVQSTPLPTDPFASLPPRPRQLSEVREQNQEHSLEHSAPGAVLNAIGQGVGAGTEMLHPGVSHLMPNPVAIVSEVVTQINEAREVAADVAHGRYGDALRGVANMAINRGLEVVGHSLGGPIVGGLVAGAYQQLASVAHSLHDHDEEVRVAQQASAWDAQRNALIEARDRGQLEGATDVRRIEHGGDPRTVIDFDRLRTDHAYAVAVRQGLQNLRAPAH